MGYGLLGENKDLFFSFLKYKAVYFRVPKVASTSILISLRQIDSVERCEEYDERCFKFAFVRNPFDRLASCYRHLICRVGVGTVFKQIGIYKNMPFDEFVDVVSKMEDNEMDMHFRPQHTFIPDVDYIGKFESLNEDYCKVLQIIGIKQAPELLKENSTQKTIYDIYTKESIEKISKIYKIDFERFNYSKELPNN